MKELTLHEQMCLFCINKECICRECKNIHPRKCSIDPEDCLYNENDTSCFSLKLNSFYGG